VLNEIKQICKDKSYCEIRMIDDEILSGFIVRTRDEYFHIIQLEPTIRNGELDFVQVKGCYTSDYVTKITFDISHRLDLEDFKTVMWIRDNILYKEKEIDKKKKLLEKKVDKKVNIK